MLKSSTEGAWFLKRAPVLTSNLGLFHALGSDRLQWRTQCFPENTGQELARSQELTRRPDSKLAQRPATNGLVLACGKCALELTIRVDYMSQRVYNQVHRQAYALAAIPAYKHRYLYIHTYIHTHIHAYLLTYLHTYIHTYLHTCMLRKYWNVHSAASAD